MWRKEPNIDCVDKEGMFCDGGVKGVIDDVMTGTLWKLGAWAEEGCRCAPQDGCVWVEEGDEESVEGEYG